LVIGHRGSERQRRWPSRQDPQRGGDPVWADVDLSVAEPSGTVCPPIVQFVGMKHVDLSRQTALNRAPVGERLHPLLGDADRVDVMPVSSKRAAAQAGTEKFHPFPGPRGVNPLLGVARTFKTAGRCIAEADAHESNLRSDAWQSHMTPPG